MRLAKNSFYSLAGQVLPLAISLITIPLYIAEIGAARYGALAIGWLLLGYFGQADFGIGRAITQRIGSLAGSSQKKMADAVWSALLIIGGFSLFAALLVYASAYYFFAGPFDVDEGLRGELLSSVWLLALCNPLVALSGVAAGSLMGLERFKLVALGNIVSNSGLQILPLAAAFLLGPNLGNLILAALVGRLLGTLILCLGTWRTFFAGQQVTASKDEINRLARFGIWIMVSALVGPLMVFADRLIIGAILGAAAVAAYTIPFQLASRAQVFPIAIVNALFPRFAAETGPAAQERCRQYSVFVGQISAPLIIGLICLAGPLLRLWLGQELDDRSVLVGQIVLAGFWSNGLANVPYAFIQARGNSRFTALLHLCELPIYFAMLFFLGLQFGLAGVAAAFALRCAIDCIALSAKAQLLGWEMLSSLAGPLLLVLIAVFASQMVTNWLPSLLLAMLLAGAAAVLLLIQVPPSIRARLSTLPMAGLIPGLKG